MNTEQRPSEIRAGVQLGDKKIKVTGQRSPRWAIWAKMMIPCKNGVPYLFRLRIIHTPLFGVYLHDIFETDAQDPHDHPWSFISIVLRGGYMEYVYDEPWKLIEAHHTGLGEIVLPSVTRINNRWSIHRMNNRSAHKIVEADPRTKTLILVGRRKKQWGFYTPESFVHWQDYEHDQVLRDPNTVVTSHD